MGLNENFSHVKSDILLKTLVLTINQAYALVIQEESQRGLGVVDMNRDYMTMMEGRHQRLNDSPNRGSMHLPLHINIRSI